MLLMRSARPVLAVYLVFSLIFPGVSSGQAIGMQRADTIPPTVTHTPLSEFPAGMPIRIQATVTDNVGIKEVTVFYREAGSSVYQRMTMLEAPGRDIYSVDLPAAAGSRIEYFIQATDLAGNIAPEQLVEPYVIALRPVDVATTGIGQAGAESAQKDATGLKGVNKWVWIGLGVVAAGVLLSSGDGGGGGGGGGPGDAGTGTVTITGPAP